MIKEERKIINILLRFAYLFNCNKNRHTQESGDEQHRKMLKFVLFCELLFCVLLWKPYFVLFSPLCCRLLCVFGFLLKEEWQGAYEPENPIRTIALQCYTRRGQEDVFRSPCACCSFILCVPIRYLMRCVMRAHIHISRSVCVYWPNSKTC